MLIDTFKSFRNTKHESLSFDLVVVGGGLTGVCASISAARKGIKVALIQDRPVLGGTGSSEIRVWMLGATSHMGNNNRWAREGGIVDEILVENTYRNKEGNPVLFDIVLIDKVKAEKNISLFLNTTVHNVNKADDRTIVSVEAFNAASETAYTFNGRLFCDSTGDGLIGYQSGATYRFGAEDSSEFEEKFTQDKKEYGESLGNSILFYFKDAGKPVKFIAPDFAMKKEDVEREIHRVHNPNYFNPMNQMGCKYWWIEYGGRLNTIYDNEEIKYKLWSVVYGIWDYIKNSGKFPEAETKTLEWVGLLPGKRESRRFVGPYMLHQQDIINQNTHYDAVAFGGWSIDLHPSDGVFSKKNACNQWHSKGVFQIPYRCYVTADVDNLFIGGRLISASHVSFGSTRVMLTAGLGGEVIGAAAFLCLQNGYRPIDLIEEGKIVSLQKLLIETGNYLPQLAIPTINNLLDNAKITSSSELILSKISFDGGFWRPLTDSSAQMLPVKKGDMPSLTVKMKATEATTSTVELRISSKSFNHTPDITLETKTINLNTGEQDITIDFEASIPYSCYAFVCFMVNEKVELMFSPERITGILSVFNKVMPAVSNWGKQRPPADIGVDEFEFWCPERRPDGHNVAMFISPALDVFGLNNLRTMVNRPVEKPNAWVADRLDQKPEVTVEWEDAKTVNEITLFVDSDFDQPMETIQWGHYDDKMPFCVDNIAVYDENSKLIAEVKGNYQTIVKIALEQPVKTSKLTLKLSNSSENVPVSIFNILIK
ncbi:MAG: FAD-dependent oxidoreductase [Prevotella sp.]|jgi:hypothetical protein|nr:FAD-dependent oxidoreductase [Prevotella sp.]